MNYTQNNVLSNEIQEMSIDEVEEVSGGVFWFAIAALAATGIEFGAVIGYMDGYAAGARARAAH